MDAGSSIRLSADPTGVPKLERPIYSSGSTDIDCAVLALQLGWLLATNLNPASEGVPCTPKTAAAVRDSTWHSGWILDPNLWTFPMSVTMREMLEAGVHFGHQTRFWNPKMAPYIFGHRNKIHIINLENTLPMYLAATQFVRQVAARRGTVLMVGTKRQSREIVATEARRAGMPYVDQRWLGGMLTNFNTVKTSLKRLKEMKARQEAGLDGMSKKEQLTFTRELTKLERDIGGIQDMTKLPDAIFLIDVGYHKIAVSEARKCGIPLVAIVDTNHSPEGIEYVIPGNDDAAKAVALYAQGIADAVLEGRANAVEEVVKIVHAAAGDEFVEVEESEESRA